MNPRHHAVEHQRPLAPKVEALAGYGLSAQEIALVLDVGLDDLQAAYGRELDTGALEADARVAESLFRKATGEGREAVVAAIFWLKTRARWRETHLHEVSGPGGSPIEASTHSPTDAAKALLLVLGEAREP